MISVGLVGAGFIGDVHASALVGLGRAGVFDVAVSHVFDIDRPRAAALASRHSARVATDLAELLAAVDVVWVCTWTSAHLAAVRAAADAKKAVFCEKPLGPSLTDAERVAAVLEEVPHQVGLVLRHAPVFHRLADILGSGRLGRPMAALMRDDQYLPNQRQYRSTWRTDVLVAGGGTLLEHSIHDLDLLTWLLGPPRAVAARTASLSMYPGIEDNAAVVLVGEGGVITTLVSVWHQILSRPSTRRLEIFCERGFAWTENDHLGPLHVETTEGRETFPCELPSWAGIFPGPDCQRESLSLYARAALTFLQALRRDGPAARGTPTVGEALAAHRVVDAAYQSAAQGGRPVTCPH